MRAASSADPDIPLGRRFIALWRVKLAVTAIVSLFFWSGYLFLSRHAFVAVHTCHAAWLDTWAGFRPRPWSWIYESIFLLTGVVPWLIVSRDELRRYVTGFGLLAAASFVVFALYPVASPRPSGVETTPFLFFITRVDGPLNAFPSLHAGCLIYNLALVRRLFSRRLHPLVAAALLVWAALILFGTLATKQHYAVDLLAGGLLGWLADWIVWRDAAGGESASERTRRKTEAASHAG